MADVSSGADVVCVLGMHRSGTSTVTRMLNLIGLSLGPPDNLLPAGRGNTKGHWEYAPFMLINDDILTRLGGSWHEPPDFPPDWERAAGFADLRRRARALIENDFPAGGWAWKDPRTCLTFPFWRQLLPAVRCVVCVRNPVEVVDSLVRRDLWTPAKAVRMWHRYVTASLKQAAGRPTLVVFYEDVLRDPRHEAARLAAFAGLRTPGPDFAHGDVDDALCHHRESLVDTVDHPDVPFPMKALYLALRLAAAGPGRPPVGPTDPVWTVLGRAAYDAQVEADHAAYRETQYQAAAETTRAGLGWYQFEVARLTAAAEEQDRAHAAAVSALRAEVAARDEQLRRLAAAADAAGGPGDGPAAGDDFDYPGLVRRVREAACAHTPAGATVLVSGRGDEAMLQLCGRTAWHFPRGEEGGYAGCYPTDSDEAVVHLEHLRQHGAEFLLVPATSFWWLGHYEGLRRYLFATYDSVHQSDACILFDLRRRRDPADARPDQHCAKKTTC